MDMSLSKLREIVKDREALYAAAQGVAKSWTQLSDWTELNWILEEGGSLTQYVWCALRRWPYEERDADDTTLKAESEEKLKNLLMKVKEELVMIVIRIVIA